MPLVRFEVRNEYGMGQPEIYRRANQEDPKAVLDGVALAGLVGILRQLGDLSEFAAEVFHGLQELVMTTSSRSHKLVVRVHKIEAALTSLEKAVLAQTSHIHFAYTAGSEWHPHIQNAQNHFIYNDLPRFIMDSYEECRDPPRLHFLDKFDTGSPGSCLKRYSDPTFFSRVSGSFKEPQAQKVQRDKKSCKSKKRRSLGWNEDLHQASMSTRSGRMHFMPSIVNGQTSPTQTASTIDMTLKSDLSDPSISFDSRTGSGNNESVFQQSSSQPEESGSKDFCLALMKQNDIIDSGFTDGQPGVVDDTFPLTSLPYDEFSSTFIQHNVILDLSFTNSPVVADDNIPHSSSSKQIVPSMSCVTWDEKAEIVEPDGQNFDGVEVTGILIKDSDLHPQEGRIANFRISEKTDVMPVDGNILKSSIIKDELDEVDSKPDNYMDALNNIESESEHDFDCQTKHEVEQVFSNIQNAELDEGIHEVTMCNSENFPLEAEYHTSTDILRNKGKSCNLPNSSSFKSSANRQMSQDGVHEVKELMSSHHPSKPDICPSSDVTSKKEMSCELHSSVPSKSSVSEVSGISSNVDYSPGSESCSRADILNAIKSECAVSYPLTSGSESLKQLKPLSEETITNSSKSQESQDQLPLGHSVSIWTNGGLLGLEPSKPPDFAASNKASQASVPGSKDSALCSSNHTSVLNNDEERGKPGRLVKDAGSMDMVSSSLCSTSMHEDQNGRGEKYNHSSITNRHTHDYCSRLNISSQVTQGNEVSPNMDAKGTSAEASHENNEFSSQAFGLGHRILANGFRRNMQCVPNGPALASLLMGTLQQRTEHNNIFYQPTLDKKFDDPTGCKSVSDSLTSSPPLEHMKISFHPIDGIEASNMKLKFPDGGHCEERIRDMFASFQLVPESSTSLHDVILDSDDDTFCRSSPYMSDDYLDQHFGSDSEHWESSGSPECNDRERYDASCRISLVESFSRSLQPTQVGDDTVHDDTGFNILCTQDGADSTFSTSLPDIPSFDPLTLVSQGETKDNLDQISSAEARYPVEFTPIPPPLPPVQWCILKAHSDVEKGKHYATSGANEHGFDLNFLEYALPQQLKPAPAKEKQANVEAASSPKSEHQGQQKLARQKEGNLPARDKGMEEDFSHQIRTQSFNLRCTETAKPTFSAGPTANSKVNAILEKANVIRQTVGSDGERDDSWSDT